MKMKKIGPRGGAHSNLFYVDPPLLGMHYPHIPKVVLLVFRVRCGTLNSNQSKECECVMEFPLSHFNVLI